VILPLHRAAYHIDMQSLAPLLVLMLHEIVIGIVLGRHRAGDALGAAGRRLRIAQQLGLGFVTAIDPTQGQQGLLIGNFLTILGLTLLFATDSHHLVIAALNDSYSIFFAGRIAAERRRRGACHRASPPPSRSACSFRAPFLVVRPGLQYRAGRAGAADAADAGLFVGVPLSILTGSSFSLSSYGR